jgi:Tol biopolymer transport system component/DNA-binding winged helix-turn-helix (wHTH) protein
MATGRISAARSIVRFGDFELDLSRQTLCRRGIRLKLQNQPRQVLALLIQRTPQVVSRDEIRQHVWGENVYIDVERNINFCIRQIRGVLLDNAAAPRFIETVPREGYRFIAPLQDPAEVIAPLQATHEPEITDQNGFAPAEQAIPVNIPKPPVGQRLILSITLAAVLAVGAVASWILMRDVQRKVSRISPVTSYPGDEREPSLSPDGREVAFSWNGEDGRCHIYVKLLGEQRPLRLTQDSDEDRFPEWSPDGKQIAFMRSRTGSAFDIILIPSIGGPERILHRVQIGQYAASSDRMMAWSPDGKWLCFTSELAPASRNALFLLSLDSGSVRPLFAGYPNASGESSPAFSPNGRWLAFSRFPTPGTGQLFFQRLTATLQPAGEPLMVSNTSGIATAPVWLSDSEHILFLDYAGSRISQARIGGAAKLVYITGNRLNGLTLDGLGTHLIASSASTHDGIETLPLQGLKAAGDAKRIVYSTASDAQPRFSPDGRWVAFRSDRSGAAEIWLADADGENPRQLTHVGAYVAGYPKWSTDSNFLVFHARRPDEGQIYTIHLKDGAIRQITHEIPGFADASFSLDGTAVYMIRDIASAPRLYRASLTSLFLQPLWLGCCAMEVPGRGILLYAKLDQHGIYARSLSGNPLQNPESRLLDDYVPLAARFAPVDDGIYYVGCTPTGQPRAFRFFSFASHQSVDIAPTPPNYDAGISIAPDRKRLAYTTHAKGSQDLVQLVLAN